MNKKGKGSNKPRVKGKKQERRSRRVSKPKKTKVNKSKYEGIVRTYMKV